MSKWKEWHRRLKESSEDIRLEVIAAELIMEGEMSLDDVFFVPLGGFHRMISKDVENIHAPGSTGHKSDRALMELNRNSIYDGIPEAVFHQNRKSRPFKTIDDIKADIAYHNEIERKARDFFGPLDNELLSTRIQIEMNERAMTADMLNATKVQGLKKFWDIPDYFTAEEQGRLMLLLPLSYRLTRDFESAGQAFSTILQIPVHIAIEKNQKEAEDDSVHFKLGQGQLGVDTVTSGGMMSELNHVSIRLGPLGIEDGASYSVGQKGYRKMSYLAEYFIPADMDYSIDVLIKEEERTAVLDSSSDVFRLGVCTFLN